jgi:hypothetical protein
VTDAALSAAVGSIMLFLDAENSFQNEHPRVSAVVAPLIFWVRADFRM